jgi:hypothetical protein
MTTFLSVRQIRIFDYPRLAEPLRGRQGARPPRRPSRPGHIISAVEGCDSYKPWHDKRTHRNFSRPDSSKCLHYYFYFIDAELGLIYLRVPTPAFAGAGCGVRFACNSIAMAIAGWRATRRHRHRFHSRRQRLCAHR